MRQLTRFELAAVKRTAQNVKTLTTKKNKIKTKIVELSNELKGINEQIEVWEGPIKVMTGGYTSEYILANNGSIPENEGIAVESPNEACIDPANNDMPFEV